MAQVIFNAKGIICLIHFPKSIKTNDFIKQEKSDKKSILSSFRSIYIICFKKAYALWGSNCKRGLNVLNYVPWNSAIWSKVFSKTKSPKPSTISGWQKQVVFLNLRCTYGIFVIIDRVYKGKETFRLSKKQANLPGKNPESQITYPYSYLYSLIWCSRLVVEQHTSSLGGQVGKLR